MDVNTNINVKRMEVAHLSGAIPFFIGEPGVGKTAVITAYASEKQMPLIDIRLATMLPEDVAGGLIPSPNKDVQVRLTPEWVKQACDEACLVFFDEFNQASEEVMGALMGLLCERSLNGMVLHPDTMMVCAGNPASSGTAVNDMPPAILNRFTLLEWDVNTSQWIEWLGSKEETENSSFKAVSKFLATHQELINKIDVLDKLDTSYMGSCEAMASQNYPSMRSWHRFAMVEKVADRAIGVGMIGVHAYNEWVVNKDLNIDVDSEEILKMSDASMAIATIQKICLEKSKSDVFTLMSEVGKQRPDLIASSITLFYSTHKDVELLTKLNNIVKEVK